MQDGKEMITKRIKVTKMFSYEKVYFIILCFNVALLNIFVGSTHNDPRTFLETTIILETLIYIIISKIKKKENVLIKGKIDIVVILMVIATFIPLLLKTYCSLSYTIDIFVEYLTVYSMYVLVRNLITTPEKRNIFLNIMLLSSCIIIIFGIDRINFNIFQKFYDMVKLPQVKDMRMTSTIGYWNAVFAYIVSLMIIALGKYLDAKNENISGIYAMYIGLAMYAFYYCNSRAGMLIFIPAVVFLFIKLKNVNKVIESIFIIIITYSLVVIFDKFNSEYSTVTTVLVGILIDLIITYIVSVLLKKVDNIKIKNARKKLIVFMLILLILGSSCFIKVKKYSKPFELSKWGDTIALYDLKNSNKYKIKIDLAGNGENLTVKVFQVDTQRNKKEIYKKEYKEKDGKILEEFEIEINQENFDKIQIQFISEEECNWTFNKVYVNGKEKIVNYKYLPNSIARLVKTLKFNNISITERISMYKSGFKLFFKHPIVGNGAKTFQNMYEKVREYSYSTMEIHSFYMDILMDYGIIGMVACLGIISITIYNFINRINKNDIIKIVVFTSWCFVAIHTIFDFDLSYMLTLANFYMIIALINEEDKKIMKNTKIIENILIIVMLICVLINIYKLPGEKMYRDGNYKEAMKYIPYYVKNTDKYIKNEKNELDKKDVLIKYLNNEINSNQYEYITILYSISLNMITNNNIDKGSEGLETIIKLIEKDDVIAKYDIYDKQKWKKFIYNMKEDVQKLSEKLNNDKLKEINEKIQIIN